MRLAGPIPGGPSAGLLPSLRTLWSRRARIDFARRGSFAGAVVLLAMVSLLAVLLTISHHWIEAILHIVLNTEQELFAALKHKWPAVSLASARKALAATPIYFTALLAGCAMLAFIWSRVGRSGITLAHRFIVVSVAAVPLLWFFLLYQVDGVAPFMTRDGDLYHGAWNPLTNLTRFVLCMGGVVLMVLWVGDLRRMYQALHD
jgi:hypothetical protein